MFNDRFSIGQRATIAGGALLLIVGAGLYIIPLRSKPIAQLPPVPEELASLSKPTLEPDVYGEFAAALASLSEEQRHVALLVYARSAPEGEIKARAWGMTKHNMKGNAREVEPFLDVLERPLVQPMVTDALATEPVGQPDNGLRSGAMYGLTKALVSGLDYGEQLFTRIENAAIMNIDNGDCRHNAMVVLLLLSERRPLAPASRNIFDYAMAERPAYFERHLQSLKNMFEAGETG